MRTEYALIFLLMAGALGICAWAARLSEKAIGKSVEKLLTKLIPPVIGNLIIVLSESERLAVIGYYIYFLGMDFVMYGLLRFTLDYCNISWKNQRSRIVLLSILGIDVLQLLCNPFFHHAFRVEAILVDGADYYQLVPLLGQSFHRLVDYAIFIAVLFTFFIRAVRSSRFNAERYYVILITMIITGLAQTFFIFSRTPIDRSMIGYGVFGLLVFYFSLYYRPLLLLDRMLSTIASEMPEALFFFDQNGACIWANRPGLALTGIGEERYEQANGVLTGLFGALDINGDDWSVSRTLEADGAVKSYVLDKHSVKDAKGRLAGSFISVRDNTVEQRTLQREIYNATHDSLTQVYNRAGYDLLFSGIDFASTYLLLIDADHFKDVNDNYGHEVGDRILRKIADTLKRHFRSEDYVCRIGGDEFVVFMLHTDPRHRELIREKIRQINADLAQTDDGLPAVTVSAGAAPGAGVSGPADWFDHADKALYETKRGGRKGVTLYEREPAIRT